MCAFVWQNQNALFSLVVSQFDAVKQDVVYTAYSAGPTVLGALNLLVLLASGLEYCIYLHQCSIEQIVPQFCTCDRKNSDIMHICALFQAIMYCFSVQLCLLSQAALLHKLLCKNTRIVFTVSNLPHSSAQKATVILLAGIRCVQTFSETEKDLSPL